MNQSKKLFQMDYERFTPDVYSPIRSFLRIMKNYELRFIWFGRKYGSTKSKIRSCILTFIMEHYRAKYGLEINWKNLGGGG